MSTWGRAKSLNGTDFSRPLKIKNVLILALVFVAATKRNMSANVVLGGRLAKRDKTVVCTFWCEVSVYYICKHLYFSCENVDISENVNISWMEPVLSVLWK